jgi:Type II CAAX prenyl endopeptidase Rce1-like
MKTTETKGTLPSLARRAWPIALLGIIGVLSLLMGPVPDSLLAKAPELAALSPLAQKSLLLINPIVLVLLAAIIGAALAHRVGLHSVLAGTASVAGFASTAARAGSYGLVLGFALAAADSVTAPLLGPAWQALVEGSAHGAASTVMGMLYGGVAEEVMLRWGVMSLAAWALTPVLRLRGRGLCLPIAITVAALIFAAGHLPVVVSQLEPTLAIVARTLLLNTLAGLLFGWLFWRYNLEAGMVAHASTHLGFAGWRLLTG